MDKRDMNILEAGIKAQTKGEVYRVICSEAGIFLPPKQDCPAEFLREISEGEKK